MTYIHDPVAHAEQEVLGTVLRYPDRMLEVVNQLVSDDFEYNGHRILWTILAKMHEENRPFDPVLITLQMRQNNADKEFGDVSYITNLRDNVITQATFSHFAAEVKLNGTSRVAMKYAEAVRDLILERRAGSAEELVAQIDRLSLNVQNRSASELVSIGSRKQKFMERMRSKENLIKIGFDAYDDWAGGIGRGWLYVLSGRSGTGKTAKAIQMAYHIAQLDVGSVLFWSQEMTVEELMERLTSSISGVPYSKIFRKTLEPEEMQKVEDAYDLAAQAKLLFDDSPSVTIGQVKAAGLRFKRKHGKIGAIFVDYLTRMDIYQDKGKTYAKAVGEVAVGFKWLARALDCPVILLAQINREGAEGKPSAHHLKESGDIEQEADTIEILWKDQDAKKDGHYKVNSSIVKGRYTGTKDFAYKFLNRIQRFEHDDTGYVTDAEGRVRIPNKSNYRNSQGRKPN